jgi:hypothetical protein
MNTDALIYMIMSILVFFPFVTLVLLICVYFRKMNILRRKFKMLEKKCYVEQSEEKIIDDLSKKQPQK